MSVARHTAYNFIGSIAPIAVSLIALPLYLRVIGVERYGLLAIFLTITTSLSFLSFGLGPAVTQRMASQHQETPEFRSELVWTALALSLISAVLGTLLWLGLGSLYFDRFATFPRQLSSEVHAAMPFVAAGLGVTLLGAPLFGALQGRHHFLAINSIQIVQSVAASVVPLAVAWKFGPELPKLVATSGGIALLGLVTQFSVVRRLVPLKRPSRPNVIELRKLSRFGGWITLISFLSPLVLIADRLIIGALRGPAQVAVYAIPYNLMQRLVLLPASFTGAVFPHLAASDASEEVRLQRKSIDALSAALTPITIAGISLLHPFLDVWVGPHIAGPAVAPGILLAAGFWIHGVCHVPSTILMGRGNLRPIVGVLVLSAPPYLALVYFLTLTFGIIGAAVAWLARASVEFFLFFWALPPRDAMLRLAMAAGLVLTAVLINLVVESVEGWTWFVKGALVVMSMAIYRDFWSQLVAKYRGMASRRRQSAASVDRPEAFIGPDN